MTESLAGGGAGDAIHSPGQTSPRPSPDAPGYGSSDKPSRAPSAAAESSAPTNDGATESGERPAGSGSSANRRRRGSRGGRGRSGGGNSTKDDDGGEATSSPELPDPPGEGSVRQTPPGPPRKPQIGDSRPAPAAPAAPTPTRAAAGDGAANPKKRRRGGRGRSAGTSGGAETTSTSSATPAKRQGGQNSGGRGGKGSRTTTPVQAILASAPAVEMDDATLAARRGRERNGKALGRYLMAVHVSGSRTQIAVTEGRSLIEHYVSRPADDVSEIHGNIYLGKVQNVLPGMEAAFVDIATPKNAVLYAGDVSADVEDSDAGGKSGPKLRIEQMLKPKQMIVCQVTKNPIGAKGARLTQEVSLPGRFVVLIPNSKTYGISKRLPDDERKRLRSILDKVKPAHHGVIVRTAAENVVEEELRADVQRLLSQWEAIDALAKKSSSPALLYREPDMAVRVIREEFNSDYRAVIIDDRQLYEEVRDYVAAISPALADRVEYHDPDVEGLPLYEKHHIHEQLHKALDRKVWLPSGGSLIIEHTEALTVIDVNTGKNVGSTSLEETVLHNNLEAAQEIAHQLRLRDIGGIIVIDFIDMEIKPNRDKVVQAFKQALARDKTRTQVFDISELGLVEMTRKRIGEGLIVNYADACPVCSGRGLIINPDVM